MRPGWSELQWNRWRLRLRLEQGGRTTGAACPDAQPIHNAFLRNLDSYQAALRNAVIDDAAASSSYSFDFCGAPNDIVPGYVPHGDPSINGTGTLEINNNKITVHIDIGDIGVDRDFPSFHTQSRFPPCFCGDWIPPIFNWPGSDFPGAFWGFCSWFPCGDS